MDPVLFNPYDYANKPNLFQSDTNLSQSTTVRTRTAPQEAQQALDKKIQASYTISDDRSNTTRQSTDLLLALQHQSKRGVGEPDEATLREAGKARDALDARVRDASKALDASKPFDTSVLDASKPFDTSILDASKPFDTSVLDASVARMDRDRETLDALLEARARKETEAIHGATLREVTRNRYFFSSSSPLTEPHGNNALQDHQMQLLLLEQQNKKRLMQQHAQDEAARDGQDIFEEKAHVCREQPLRSLKPQPAMISLPKGPNSHESGPLDFEVGTVDTKKDFKFGPQKVVCGPSSTGQDPALSTPEPPSPTANLEKSTAVSERRPCDQNVISGARYVAPKISDLRDSPILQSVKDDPYEELSRRFCGEQPPLGSAQLEQYACYLHSKLQLVQNENDALRRILAPMLRPRWQVLYRIPKEGGDVYLDRPQWVTDEQGSKMLRSSMPLTNFALYLERNKDIALIVFQDFNADCGEDQASDNGLKSTQTTAPPIEPFQESIRPVSQELKAAITCLLDSDSTFLMFREHFQAKSEIVAPYLCIYHTRESFHPLLEGLSQMSSDHFDLLKQCISERFGDEYSRLDNMISHGMIHRQLIKYLFKPGQLVFSTTDGVEKAYMMTTWPKFIVGEPSYKGTLPQDLAPSDNEAEDQLVCEFKAWSWCFHGSFKQEPIVLNLRIPKDAPNELRIADLNVYPFQFTCESIRSRLEARGKILWSCRFRRFVSYQSESADTQTIDLEDSRYMVDLETFKKLHPESAPANCRDDLGAKRMAMQDPPSRDFLMMLPSTVKGFNLREKKWHNLEVDRIRDVPWNKKAFESLVLPEKTKKIIRALVTKQLTKDKSTDLIKGKGNGLIILLHGGPGTGKTLTAESIAEIAEKPLYRVTCGDVGTNPEDVEKYMESVLHLGKFWDCVVLLDEADVFLQERNLHDLQRNALVSIFLRVLEYHEGILFLTSNRIGTFDEAFKSRIQLSLHYKPLGLPERKKVWLNFVKHLEDLGEANIDFDDLKFYVDKLAEKELNGRQIRNAITIARQLAQYDSEKLNHEHLEDVILIAADFDDYVKGLNEDMSDEERMRELQIR